MIDFSTLVLGPAMTVFARPVTWIPTKSQAGAPPYAGRGVWAFKAVEEALSEGTYHSTNQPTLGIRLGDFDVNPLQGDGAIVDGISYDIVDVVPDGQGGADVMLRKGKAR